MIIRDKSGDLWAFLPSLRFSPNLSLSFIFPRFTWIFFDLCFYQLILAYKVLFSKWSRFFWPSHSRICIRLLSLVANMLLYLFRCLSSRFLSFVRTHTLRSLLWVSRNSAFLSDTVSSRAGKETVLVRPQTKLLLSYFCFERKLIHHPWDAFLWHNICVPGYL